MDNNYISAPNNFVHMEGNSVDFKKTFDLNGTDNDEMLRLYLRKAGLSDEIEYLTPQQRRAFIYDIIKSNKMPGYWMPSTMKTSSFEQAPPAVRPPPPPVRQDMASSNLQYAKMNTSSSSNSLKSMTSQHESPVMPHRFIAAPNTPPSPSSIVTNRKGLKIEISGPINFKHVSGDMTRDMTRNAFDLSITMSDNVLKKYLMERGIRDEDISGIRKPDLIRKIVQSNYTWMPPQRNIEISQQQDYTYNVIEDNTRLQRPPTYVVQTSQKAPEPLSNYATITSRFADPSLFPSPDNLFADITEPEPVAVKLPPLPPQTIRPAPPPRKPKSIRMSNGPPPPPSALIATPNNSTNIYSAKFNNDYDNDFDSVSESSSTSSIVVTPVEDLYATVQTKSKPKPNKKPFVTPPIWNSNISSSPAPPSVVQSNNQTNNNIRGPPPPAMPKVNADFGSPLPPAPPMPQLNTGFGSLQPPPPPPMPKLTTASGVPPPPPPPMPKLNTAAGGLPPPPPPMVSNKIIATSTTIKAAPVGDPRDAFLESIRNGVALKKVNQKAATVSGPKPRAEPKAPPVNDFLSELKMGINLRKVKIKNPVVDDEGHHETDA